MGKKDPYYPENQQAPGPCLTAPFASILPRPRKGAEALGSEKALAPLELSGATGGQVSASPRPRVEHAATGSVKTFRGADNQAKHDSVLWRPRGC